VSDVKWKVVGLWPGEPRNGRTIAVQVSLSDMKPPRFSFGVGVMMEGAFKPTAFLQDRDVEEYVVLLIAAKRAIVRAVAEALLGGAPPVAPASEGDVLPQPEAPKPEVRSEDPKGPLRVTLGDQIRAKGGKLAVEGGIGT